MRLTEGSPGYTEPVGVFQDRPRATVHTIYTHVHPGSVNGWETNNPLASQKCNMPSYVQEFGIGKNNFHKTTTIM